ncbi:MAG: cytochrome c [Chloroflexi bacterium]|nr:cytochrome c [Chloroflexota bacterium]
MKLRYAILFIFTAVLLSACTLASDITPPPDYIAPTPMPTLGALFPASAPNVQNGATIFATECVPCHGNQGLGDGPQSQQLPVPVPAIGMAEKGQLASPAEWFTVVTRGNMDRFMPPFADKLSDQERWDVVSYAMTLHTTPDQIAQGKSLFDTNCPNCAAKFTNQEKMSALSEADLIGIIRKGNGDIPAFGSNFSDADASAVAAYLRTLTFAAPTPPTATPTTASVSTEAATTVNGTPSTPGTPATPAVSETGTVQSSATGAATQATTGTPGTPAASVGNISGTVQMASGASLPTNMVVTLRGFDHAQDPTTKTTSPQEVLTKTGTVAADGAFVFENVDLPVNRIYVAEVSYSGVQYQSDFTAVKAGDTKLSLPAVKLYETSSDTNLLTVEQVHLYSDFATQGTAQFIEIYSFSNNSDKAVIISTDGSSIPFIKLPDGAQGAGYQAGQNSAPFVSADKGVAVVPSDTPYSIIGFFTLPYDKQQVVVNQPFAINAASVLLLIPEGMTVDSKQLTNAGVQTIQNNNYQEFSAKNFKAGDTLSFTVSGSPKADSSTTTTPNTQQGLLFGAGALGLALIVAGVWLYLRDRRRGEEDDEENEFESADEVMDAMLSLDDLHRAGKISDEAYQKRRDELKEILKEMS